MLYYIQRNLHIWRCYAVKKWMQKLGFQEMDEMQKLIALKAQRNALIYVLVFLLLWDGVEIFRAFRYNIAVGNLPTFLLSTLSLVLIGSQIYYQQKVLKGSEEGAEYTKNLVGTLIKGFFLIVVLLAVGTWLMLQ